MKIRKFPKVAKCGKSRQTVTYRQAWDKPILMQGSAIGYIIRWHIKDAVL
jgi:hypothetical protein